MTNERAIEILDPEHREHYESIESVEEACRIGIKAIKRVKELEAENAALRERLEKAVELPCKIGDTVYGIGFTDCDDRTETDPKIKKKIFNTCLIMGGHCEKCKYGHMAIEEFVCTHIQIGENGIMGSNVLVVGEKNENYHSENVFTTRDAAEVRLAKLKGGKE